MENNTNPETKPTEQDRIEATAAPHIPDKPGHTKEQAKHKGLNLSWTPIIIALIAGISAIISLGVFSGNLVNYKKSAGSEGITVTGSANRDFESDLIVWRGSFSAYGETPKEAYQVIKQDADIIRKYLTENGVICSKQLLNHVFSHG